MEEGRKQRMEGRGRGVIMATLSLVAEGIRSLV